MLKSITKKLLYKIRILGEWPSFSLFEKISLGSIILGFFVFLFILIEFLFNTSGLYCTQIDSNIWGHFGSIIGGIFGPLFSLCAIFLLLENLKQQRNSLKQQKITIDQEKISFIRDQIENRFFQLVSYHKQNVNEIKALGKNKDNIFNMLLDEYHSLFDTLLPFFVAKKIGNIEHPKELIKVAYILFFYGYDPEKPEKTENLVNWITSITNSTINFHEFFSFLENSKKIFSDNQSQLGHYYRHLFQTVNYINEQKENIIDYHQKYNYVKILRAQLSNYEQALLFYNTISPLGEAWELKAEKTDINHHLITKYNMIKNLPNKILRTIDPKEYYPTVSYEYDKDLTKDRIILEERYH